MAKAIRVTILIGFFLFIGFCSGWYYAQFSNLKELNRRNFADKEFQAQLEGLTPSCDDLASEGIKGPYPLDKGYVFVYVQPKAFHVIGFKSEPNVPFTTGWWGAERQKCEEKKP